MSYPLIVLILGFTLGYLGWYYLDLYRTHKKMATDNIVLSVMTKSLYTHLVAASGQEQGEIITKRALQYTRDILEKEYGIEMSHLEIRQQKKQGK
jgi:hypothetical protein